MDLQLPMQSVPITTDVVRSNLDQAEQQIIKLPRQIEQEDKQ